MMMIKLSMLIRIFHAADRLNMKFCKQLIGVYNKATNIAVWGELGRYPLYIKIVTQMIKYYHRVACMPQDHLLCRALNMLSDMDSQRKENWYSCVKFILAKLDLKNIMEKPSEYSTQRVSNNVKHSLKENFYRNWHDNLIKKPIKNGRDSNKLRTYKMFKTTFIQEPYLDHVKNIQVRKQFTRFRISAHNLEF